MSLNPPLRDWRGKTVWLIGASTGIGAALAHDLHRLGATVAVSARSPAPLQQFADSHPGAIVLPVDVLQAPALHEALRTLVAQAGGVDLVFYCAGAYTPMRADQFNLASATAQLQTNYQGALNCLDAVLPQLLAQASSGRGGHLSLVSSVAGYRGLPKALAYGPAKAALIHLAEVLFLDLRPKGLGVSVVNPGFVATPMTAQNDFKMPALLTPEQASAAILKGYAAGRFDIHFPKRFTLLVKAMRWLPARLYFWLVRQGTGQ
jgi:NAD(P)-dependent dehydrogenase (short-subunit alcohol dehydrogenase family)